MRRTRVRDIWVRLTWPIVRRRRGLPAHAALMREVGRDADGTVHFATRQSGAVVWIDEDGFDGELGTVSSKGQSPTSEIYLAALLDCISFIELSGSDVIDTDAAVRQLESVASLLRSDPAAAERIAEEIAAFARAEGDPQRRELFDRLPAALGL